ncbi:MAG TPA: RNA polymerase sigma factor [Nocardioides sp.]|nr:RNA polymerase sigma factor [Nocardioides sp.]
MRRYDVTDEDLLQQVAAGDEAALRALFDRHAAWLRLRLQRRSSDPDLVADALQDTFVAAWKSAAKYRGDGDVGGWLWGIAIRRLVSRLRARRAPTPVAEDLLTSASPVVESAEDQLLVAVEYGDVGDALRSLSPELRTVVQATVIDGLTTREAARLLGLPQGTVKSRMRRVRSELRGHLLSELGRS